MCEVCEKGKTVHIIWLGYLFVITMFCFAQPSLLRGAVLFVLLAVLPTLLVAWVLRTRRRNRLEKWQQQNGAENRDVVAK